MCAQIVYVDEILSRDLYGDGYGRSLTSEQREVSVQIPPQPGRRIFIRKIYIRNALIWNDYIRNSLYTESQLSGKTFIRKTFIRKDIYSENLDLITGLRLHSCVLRSIGHSFDNTIMPKLT